MIFGGIIAWLLYAFGNLDTTTTEEAKRLLNGETVRDKQIRAFRKSEFVSYYQDTILRYLPEYSIRSFPIVLLGGSENKRRGKNTFSFRNNPSLYETHLLKCKLKSIGYVYLPTPELYFFLRCHAMQLPELALLASTMCASDFFAHQHEPLTTKTKLLDFFGQDSVWHKQIAREAISFSFEKTESHMERALALLLHLPKKYGGCGYEKPETNSEIILSKTASKIFGESKKVRPDFLFKNKKLILEYDSKKYHGNTKSIMRDKERQCALEQMGYRVLPITGKMLLNPLSRLELLSHIGKTLQTPFFYSDSWEWHHRNLTKLLFEEPPIF